jgi:hypothetical protein
MIKCKGVIFQFVTPDCTDCLFVVSNKYFLNEPHTSNNNVSGVQMKSWVGNRQLFCFFKCKLTVVIRAC